MGKRSSRVNGAKYRAATDALIQRILSRREVNAEGCWPWPGSVNADGYGIVMVPMPGKRRLQAMVHRLIYMHLVDPDLPDDLQVDHTCHKPAKCAGGPTCPHRRCFNPDHLEGVPQEINRQRAAKVRCPARHDYEVYGYVDPRTGQRNCRKCQAKAAARKKAALRPILRQGHVCRECGADISTLDGRMWYCDDCRFADTPEAIKRRQNLEVANRSRAQRRRAA